MMKHEHGVVDFRLLLAKTKSGGNKFVEPSSRGLLKAINGLLNLTHIVEMGLINEAN